MSTVALSTSPRRVLADILPASFLAQVALVIGGAALSGGVGNFFGTALGALILTTVTSGLIIINVAANWDQVAVALLIAAAVLLQQYRNRVRK